MLLQTPLLLAIALPICATLALDVRAPVSLVESSGFFGRSVNASYLETLSERQRQVFDYVIEALDENFSPPFLFNSPRYSAWYAVGLLARNGQEDVETASEILKDVISFQFTDPNTNWYGTFKNDPSAPDPGDVYPPLLYTSYDTNIALFVCTSFIIIMEEFQHLLEPSLVTLLKNSMYNATIGDGYRVGGFNGDGYSAGGFIGDNLYPIYSNPWYMRVMSATYVGNMMGDANMSFWGDQWATEAIENFNLYETLAEFNSGTYTGVTLYALSLWGYMPQNSTIVKHARDIITKTWTSIAANVLTPLIAKFNDPYVPAAVLVQLQGLAASHAYFAQAVSPPWDNPTIPRNYTSWTAPGLSIGAITSDEKVIGGAATNQDAYVPATIIWSAGNQTAWFNMYPTSGTIAASASSKGLTIAYPTSKAFNSTLTSNVMTFLLSGFPHLTLSTDFLANGTGVLPGLRLEVSGNVVSSGTRTLVYGSGTINDFPYYNLTYAFDDLGEVPRLMIEVEKI
ncbi:Chitin synthase 4 [Mycena sanguinolenta]|uniref:Chitin synthase 4 n=1 Tax=Mycena sanguinolenta TaxID=230812 RepID=A0A8H6YES5_9AGAR|nr:Chitin synthase 4 [Mycena sanguinolenta]